jgi:hypothetical protein
MAAIALAAGVLACTIPGTASPTPFVFPTPNLTLTAVFRPTETQAPPGTVTAETTPEQTEAAATNQPDGSATAVSDGRGNGPTILAPRLDQPPTIDGDLNDWPEQRWSATEVVYGASNWSSGSDLSASFAVAWDSQYLYLAATVNDESHVQIASGNNLYEGDSLEILLDTALEADFNSSSLSGDDYQIGLSPGDFNSRQPEAYRWFPASQRGALTSVDIDAQQSSDGYQLEARLPWTIFGMEPVQADMLGFAFSASDNDQAGSSNQQSMVSSAPTRILTDPTSWGTLLLSPASD